MNDKRKVLGRGLESLLPGKSSSAVAVLAPGPDETAAYPIRIEMIEPNPYQTRKRIDPEGLKELTESVKAAGVVQPILVRPLGNGTYQLVAGERRLQAAKLAGLKMIPAVVRQISNEKSMEITIIENLQREDLTPMEQAFAFDRLNREFGLTQEEIAARTGKDRASIANFWRLLKLPKRIQEWLQTGELSFGHGKVLCTMIGLRGEHEQLEQTAQEIVKRNLSVRQAEELVARILNPDNAGKSKPEPKPQDPNVREAAHMLEQALGVKVEIRDRKGKGKIILKYGSLDDFDRIVEALGKR